jgi:hypothetical protein
MKIKKVKLVSGILLITVLLNTFIGYPYSNILIGLMPVNELLLFFSILLIFSKIPKLIYKYKLLIPLAIFSIINILRAFINFFSYGIWAFRDVMHYIEIWWMIPTLYLAEYGNIKTFIRRLFNISLFLLPVKLLALLTKSYSSKITISGMQGDIPLLTNFASIGLILFFVLSYAIFVEKNRIYRILSFFYFLFFLIVLQSRNIYLCLIISLLYFLYLRFSLKTLINLFKYLLLTSLLLFLISHLTFLNEYTRFGIENVNPIRIMEHLYTITGKTSNEELVGAAGGVSLRLVWWYNLYQKTTESLNTFLFGLGFGVPLTDFKVVGGRVVRELHNSFLSTYGRTGIVGFLLWFSILSFIILRSLMLVKKEIKRDDNFIFITINFVFIYVFFLALSEPPFELPFEATVIYIFLAIIYFYIKNYRRRNRYEKRTFKKSYY